MNKFNKDAKEIDDVNQLEGDFIPVEELMKPLKVGEDAQCFIQLVKPDGDHGPSIQVAGTGQDLMIGTRILVEYIVSKCDVPANVIFREIYAALEDELWTTVSI